MSNKMKLGLPKMQSNMSIMRQIRQIEKLNSEHDSDFNIRGTYLWELFRNDKMIDRATGHNLIVNAGRNALLNIMFCGATQITQWFVGLIADTGYTGVDETDIMSDHDGWTEFAGYSGNRPEWTPEDSSGQILINTTPIEYTFSTGGVVKGYFINSVTTISGTTGTLWSAALFDADRTVAGSDVARLTLSIEY